MGTRVLYRRPIVEQCGRIEANAVAKTVMYSGTDTEFYVPDLWSQAAIMAINRAFLLNPDLFRTIF